MQEEEGKTKEEAEEIAEKPVIVEEEPISVMQWQENKKEAPMLLILAAKAKEQLPREEEKLSYGDKIKCSIEVEPQEGLILPLNGFEKSSVDNHVSYFGVFEYTKPGVSISALKIKVKTEVVRAVK